MNTPRREDAHVGLKHLAARIHARGRCRHPRAVDRKVPRLSRSGGPRREMARGRNGRARDVARSRRGGTPLPRLALRIRRRWRRLAARDDPQRTAGTARPRRLRGRAAQHDCRALRLLLRLRRAEGPLAAEDGVRLASYPAGFQPGRLYELIYRAKDPTVAGLGFAAMRDIGAFLRNAPQDDFGAQNPVYRPDNVAIVEGTSQGGRM